MKEDVLIQKYIERAYKALEDDKLVKALDLFSRANELSNEEDVDIIIEIALIYDSLGKSETAKEYYNKALRIDENEERAYYGLAVIYDEDELYDEAIRLYKKAIYISPNYHKAYFFLANVYDICGEEELAIITYEKLLSLNPMDFWANTNVGSIYEALGKNDLAYKRFSKALEIKPNNYLALFNMGVIAFKFNMINKAIGFYNRSIKMNPIYAYSYLNLAVIYKYKDTEKGIEVLTKGIENCEEVHFLYYNRSCFYTLIGENHKACNDLIEALNIYPDFLKYILEDEELEEITNMNCFKEFVENEINDK
ncbi:tetratricopeptide repeat protein [Clostridium paridis]|uniref:Tetratricopeptide repeat protein n=1 Tax=Clostridium paridis TaxID=2803863 RepID=A0A937K3W5_9CLOT|nr:tetratricopeptide repeat protein [Clostridium paridis]MBL4931229.1 tetratricopeptide repeat protein [Clostridium paridis]